MFRMSSILTHRSFRDCLHARSKVWWPSCDWHRSAGPRASSPSLQSCTFEPDIGMEQKGEDLSEVDPWNVCPRRAGWSGSSSRRWRGKRGKRPVENNTRVSKLWHKLDHSNFKLLNLEHSKKMGLTTDLNKLNRWNTACHCKVMTSNACHNSNVR